MSLTTFVPCSEGQKTKRLASRVTPTTPPVVVHVLHLTYVDTPLILDYHKGMCFSMEKDSPEVVWRGPCNCEAIC